MFEIFLLSVSTVKLVYVYTEKLQYKTAHGLHLSVFNSMQVLTIMEDLSCDNAIYEDINEESSHGGFDIHENECYGKVTPTAIKNHEEKWYSYRKVTIMAFVIVFALLLGIAGACVAFALQITMLKSEIASLKTASSMGRHLYQNSKKRGYLCSTCVYIKYCSTYNKYCSGYINTALDI